jgi:hypothetical protein
MVQCTFAEHQNPEKSITRDFQTILHYLFLKKDLINFKNRKILPKLFSHKYSTYVCGFCLLILYQILRIM